LRLFIMVDVRGDSVRAILAGVAVPFVRKITPRGESVCFLSETFIPQHSKLH